MLEMQGRRRTKQRTFEDSMESCHSTFLARQESEGVYLLQRFIQLSLQISIFLLELICGPGISKLALLRTKSL